MPNTISSRFSSRAPTSHARRWPGIRPILILLAIPLVLVLVDPDAPHRAGAPRGPLARMRVRLARWITPTDMNNSTR
jgi:hypothetical protein